VVARFVDCECVPELIVDCKANQRRTNWYLEWHHARLAPANDDVRIDCLDGAMLMQRHFGGHMQSVQSVNW
jgi:hypothetical protein